MTENTSNEVFSMIHPDHDALQRTYKSLASVILADPDAKISGRTILDGKPVGELVSDMAAQLHSVGAEIQQQRDRVTAAAPTWETHGCSTPGCGYPDGKPCIRCGLVIQPLDAAEYVPADIIEGDRVLATHCETFLCTECEMTREDRMKRITQSIADYRECHATRARKGQRPE